MRSAKVIEEKMIHEGTRIYTKDGFSSCKFVSLRGSYFSPYAFIDPAVMPEMNWRWSRTKSTMIGTETNVAAAIISP